MASNSSQSARMAGRSAMSPSMLTTPSDDPDLTRDFGIDSRFFELDAHGVQVVVLVDGAEDALLDRAREPDRVDDRRMVKLVGDDDVAGLAQRGEHRFVGVPAGDEGVRRLGP